MSRSAERPSPALTASRMSRCSSTLARTLPMRSRAKIEQAVDQGVHLVQRPRQEAIARGLVEQLVELVIDGQQRLVVPFVEDTLKVAVHLLHPLDLLRR